jgi:deoxyribonuclease-2
MRFLLLLPLAMARCLNEAGTPVSFWALLKFPHGSSYLYADATTVGVSPYSLNASETTFGGAMANTMNQLWTGNWQYALYNDEPPAQTTYNFTVGHSKGVWMWSGEEATWIQHSFPKFPEGPLESPAGFPGIPTNIWEYGQHAFCVSMNRTDLATIATEWQLVLPQVYETNYPMDGSFPAMEALLRGQWSEDPVCQPWKVYGTVPLLGFAKSTQWGQELYASCMAPVLGTDLLVESWLHSDAEGPSCQPTYKFNVGNVGEVAFPGSAPFLNWNDHSKWAIGDGWACFSDINRATSQSQRGGGAICLANKELHDLLTLAIVQKDGC